MMSKKINIILPMAQGKTVLYNNQEDYPIKLVEFNNKTILEFVIENYQKINQEKKIFFLLNELECKKFYINNIIKNICLCPNEMIIFKNQTKGAACSCLFISNYIPENEELIIANSDQIIDDDLNFYLQQIRQAKSDVSVLCFNSVNPRCSYALCDENTNNIIQIEEKNPISRNAIAGFYYFKKAKDFFDASKKAIISNPYIDNYYIAPTINQLILENKKVVKFDIDKNKYHTFFSLNKINEYEKRKY